MTYVDIVEFRRDDGFVNFNAYLAAQIANGDKCYRCQTYVWWGGRGQRALCRLCEEK